MISEIIIKSVKIVDINSTWNNQVVDIHIENGIFKNIDRSIVVPNAEVFQADGLSVSLGWIDVFANCPDPGELWKESLTSLAKAAQIGGFTSVAAMCGTDPLPENASLIGQTLVQAKRLTVNILPLGLSSEKREGKEMAEVYEMHKVGAVGQTDGVVPSASVSLRSKLMQYCASLDIPYLHFPFEGKLVSGGSVNEGFMNVNLGLKGLPFASETISLLADLEMAKWLNTPVKIIGISCKESVEIVRKAKANQINVRVAVPIMNLVYTENAVGEFDENYKVLPPLRTEADRKALIDAVLDGTIDAIMSNHLPSDIESKNVEFDYAHYGTATLPTFFPLLLEAFGDKYLDKAIQALTVGACNFYNLPVQTLTVGSNANLTFFTATEMLELTNQNKGSKAYNVLGLNQSKQGKVVATFCKGKLNKN